MANKNSKTERGRGRGQIRPKKGYIYCLYKIGLCESYIGSTFRLSDRKSEHRSRCNDIGCKEFVFPVYSFIRCNGGFNEWEFRVIETGMFNSTKELKSRERHYQDIYWDNLLNTIRAR
jgi:hypothetical protein